MSCTKASRARGGRVRVLAVLLVVALAAFASPLRGVTASEDEVEVERSGRQLQCSGYWGSYGSCKNGKRCRLYTSTYVAPKPYVAPAWKAPASLSTSGSYSLPTTYSYGGYSGFGGGYSGWNDYSSFNWKSYAKRRSLQESSVDYAKLRNQEAEASGRSLLCTATGESQCTTSGCPQPKNCAGYWTSYGSCSGGQKCRHYVHTTSAANGGAGCPYSNWHAQCTTSGCPQATNCAGYWTSFGSCGGGKKCRHYVHTTSAANGRAACPYSNWHKDCTQSGCPQPVNCAGYWSSYGGCHKSGSQNRKCRKYIYTTHPSNGGAGCGYSNGQNSCTTSGCTQPVDCAGAWGSYGGCHKSGSTNRRCRHYKHTRSAAHGGSGCPYSNMASSCTTSGCSQPVNCAGYWTGYGSCYYEGSTKRNLRCKTYKVTKNASNGGSGCPYSNNHKSCTTSGCSQPVDCAGYWTSYGGCSGEDDSDRGDLREDRRSLQSTKNERCRTYKVTKNAAHNGAGCPYSNNYRQCTTSGCSQPVNCVGAWGAYGSCHKSGSTNRRCRYYKHTKSAAHGGSGCPYANNYKQCTTGGCAQPVNCVGAWGAYGSCYHQSSNHKNYRCRYYKYTKSAAHNGYGCPYANNYKQCTTSGCSQPVDCAGYWGGYGSCYHQSSNHKNYRCRYYKYTKSAAHNGYGCPYANNYKQCTTSGCSQPVDCAGYWAAYGSCFHDSKDHKNRRCRYYKHSKSAAHNGYGCAYANNYKQCTTSGCGSQPVDCAGSWGGYGSCYHDNSDHKNKRCKYYKVTTNAAHNGYGCPYSHMYKSCTSSGCSQPVDCVGSWGQYGSCASAGSSNKRCRHYKISKSPAHNGYSCPHSHNEKFCTTLGCSQPVGCVGAFGSYGSCYHDNSDHKNKRCRKYVVSTNAAHGGSGCPYNSGYNQCTTGGCTQPVDCLGYWAAYGPCSGSGAPNTGSGGKIGGGGGDPSLKELDDSFGGGGMYVEDRRSLLTTASNKRCRLYKVTRNPSHNGYTCPYSNNYQSCTISGCSQPVDCVGSWGSYASCYHDSSDHKNKRCRYYKVTTNAAYNGKSCAYSNNYKQCTTSGCAQPLDCAGAWGAYGSCKHNSDHKNRRCRNYKYTTNAANNGYGCAYTNNYQQCTTSGCSQPVDCVGSWGAYGSCSYDNKDHENERCRVYTVTQGPKHNGFACPHANNLRHCTKSGCGQPVDCEGEWSAYGVCFHDPSSKKNQKCRKYKYTTNAASNGKSCPHSEGKSECVTSGCPQPVNCVGSWGSYGSCYHDSSNHKNKRCRKYKVTTNAAYSGSGCPYANNYQSCTTSGCAQPIDCTGAWGAYGSCNHDSKDHKNRRCRNYKYTTNNANNGYGCAYADNYKQCTTGGCAQPVDCAGGWAAYGSCFHDSKDHKNRRCRLYKYSTSAAHNGYGCPYSNNYKQCTTSGCSQPVDCVGSWGAYSTCAYVGTQIPNLSPDLLKIVDGDKISVLDVKAEKDVIPDLNQFDDFSQDRRSLLGAEHKNQRCRTYSVSVKADHNGFKCPFENNFEQCTEQGCGQPVDCVGSWGAYGSCKHNTNDHKNRRCRLYKITVDAKDGGHGCPFKNDFESCTVLGCAQPVDCVGSWDSFGSCFHDGKDHKNRRCRNYKIAVNAANSGYGCPHSHNHKHCTTSGCSQPTDCAGSWAPYGSCFHDSKDHKNRRCRLYKVGTSAANNGYGCPYTHNYKSCTTVGCSQPVDCLGSWGSYTSCSYVGKKFGGDLSLGGGGEDMVKLNKDDTVLPDMPFDMLQDRRSLLGLNHANERCRTYKVSRKSSHNGYTCPYVDGFTSCTQSGCSQPVDCVGSWDAYGPCKYVQDKHQNTKCKTYKVTTKAAFNGLACLYSDNHVSCTNGGCAQPSDCVGSWGNYGTCSYDKDSHKNKRCKSYKIVSAAAYNGKGCPYANQAESCTPLGCLQPVDCVGSWTAFGQCKHDKDEHVNVRCKMYKISQPAFLGGYQCPHEDKKEHCSKMDCSQPVDCVGGFGDYDSCFYDKKDHKNKRCKKFEVNTASAHNGYGCAYSNMYETCTSQGCEQPVDCIGSWGQWGLCEYDGHNHKNRRCRFYKITRKPDHSGYDCPFSDSYKSCTVQGCAQPMNCVGQWDTYGICKYDKEKHANKRCKAYKIVSEAKHNGHGCLYATGKLSCTTTGCAQPVDCVGSWGAYDACSYDNKDHENERCRVYSVSQIALNNGFACPHEDKLQQCTKSGCGQPVDCEGEWTVYGSCSHVASSHKNERCRTFEITTKADLNGKQCPHKNGKVDCTTDECSQPVDCVGDWGAYGSCFHDNNDHKNRRCRAYAISTNSAHNGYGCPYANAYKQCTTRGCVQPVDCQGEWEDYGTCTYDDSDHKNKRCRTYAVTRSSAHNGYACPYTDKYEQCTSSGCSQPVDCVGAWDEFDSCSYDEDTHTNNKCRFYKVSVAAAHNGLACPRVDAFKQCTNDGCAQPVDCAGAWQEESACAYDEVTGKNTACHRFGVLSPAENNGKECAFEEGHLSCSSEGCDKPVDCVGEWSDYGECSLSEDLGLNTRCRLYNVVRAAENNGKECAYEQDFEACTTSGCEQAPPPPPPATGNSTVISDDGESSDDGSGQSSGDGKDKDSAGVDSQSAQDGSLDESREEELETSTASAPLAMIGGAVAGAVCCMMGLAFVYVRQKRKRGEAARQAAGVYKPLGHDSPDIFGQRNQSMLLMNPMFASSGSTRKSTVNTMSSAGRMSFLSNPLFDTSDQNDGVEIPDSPNGSDSEAELLGGGSALLMGGADASAFSNPLYATSGKAQGGGQAESFEESMARLGADFESSFDQISEYFLESNGEGDNAALQVAISTWNEINADIVQSGVEADVQTAGDTLDADKLAQLKQSLNKIEQGALLSGRMSMDAKNNFMSIINQARSKLRHVESVSRARGNTVQKAAKKEAEVPEWVTMRNKLKAINKFKLGTKK